MKLMDYALREALRRREVSEDPHTILSIREALGLRSRPPLGLQCGSKDTPALLLNRTIGES